MRGLYPRRQTPHPSAMLRIASTLSHKGRGAAKASSRAMTVFFWENLLPTVPMTAPEAASPAATPARASWREILLVYLQRRVLVVLLLGFSAGLPFSLAGQTLQAWMTESGVDIKTIGLFAFVGTPY